MYQLNNRIISTAYANATNVSSRLTKLIRIYSTKNMSPILAKMIADRANDKKKYEFEENPKIGTSYIRTLRF